MPNVKKSVILDTDIGGDIDDSWALAMLLASPGLDVKLISVATGDVRYRAAMVRRLLIAAGREDIPVAVGRSSAAPSSLAELAWPPAGEYPDAVAAMTAILRAAETPVTIIEIAPASNLGDLLAVAPELAAKADLVVMGGSIARGISEGSAPIAEYNVRSDIPAAQAVFSAPWHSFTLVPLDSSADVHLPGNWVKILAGAPTAWAREVGLQYLAWLHHWGYDDRTCAIPGQEPIVQSSPLFDTVAVHAAQSAEFLRFQKMPLMVDDAGFCRTADEARPVRVAIGWQDRAAYQEKLMKLFLTGSIPERKPCR